MPYATPFRGVNGARHRENDEGHTEAQAPRTMLARYAGKCINTGERIAPGDEIIYTRGVGSVLVRKSGTAEDDGRYISNVIRTSGGTFYRNKRGTCEDAPCCGCCTI